MSSASSSAWRCPSRQKVCSVSSGGDSVTHQARGAGGKVHGMVDTTLTRLLLVPKLLLRELEKVPALDKALVKKGASSPQ